MLILPSTIACCPVLNGWSDFRPLHCWPRWYCSSNNITCSSWPDLFLGRISIYLRLYLSVLELFDVLGCNPRPNILIWAFYLYNILSKFCSFSPWEKWGFDFRQSYLPHLCYFLTCRCFFTCKWVCSWRFGIWDASTFTMHDALSPTFYGVMKILRWSFFYGDLSSNFLAYFSHPYISCSKNPDVPLFESSTLKNQSEVPFHIFVSYL